MTASKTLKSIFLKEAAKRGIIFPAAQPSLMTALTNQIVVNAAGQGSSLF
jgi:hypothetical protein